jgi:hypothetical protein
MTQVGLQGSGIVPPIGERKAAGVSQHYGAEALMRSSAASPALPEQQFGLLRWSRRAREPFFIRRTSAGRHQGDALRAAHLPVPHPSH